MHPFQDYVYQKFADQMRSWPPEIAHDICLMACMIGYDEDDVRRPNVGLIATTPEFWASTYTPSNKDPGMKWYSAGVTPLEILTLCEGSGEWYGSDDLGDTECVALRNDYFQSLGLLISDQEQEQRYPLYGKREKAENGQATITPEETETLETIERRRDAVEKAFMDVRAETVRRLFEDGTIAEVCGKPVPVIFQIGNDMGDQKYLLTRMREVNPPGLTEEYYQWYKGRYSGAEQWP